MSVTYKDIDELTQKSSVAGTEKIPISDTQYISPLKIAEFSDNNTYVIAWDGSSTPVVANIPVGVTVTYNGTDYTGTLEASENTCDKVYIISDGNGHITQKVTDYVSGAYLWANRKYVTDYRGGIVEESILTIYAALSDAAFTNGKPSIPLSITCSVTYNLSNATSSNTSISVPMGDSYSTTLGVPSNLYVIDTTTLSVTMDGVDITSSAYSGGVISIPVVTGDVVITASAITYSSGLVFHLDGLNKGNDNTVWTDTVGNISFALANCTFADKGVVFGQADSVGTTASSFRSFARTTCTIEACFKKDTVPTSPFIILWHTSPAAIALNWNDQYKCFSIAEQNVTHITYDKTGFTEGETLSVSFSVGAGMINGTTVTDGSKMYFTAASGSTSYIGNRQDYSRPLLGTLYSLRIYNRVLTTEERQKNYMVDVGRFNL